MSFTLNAFNQAEWQRHGLADYCDYCDMILECNVGEDSFSGYGEWFYVPDDAACPTTTESSISAHGATTTRRGQAMYTHAEIFDMTNADDAAEFAERVQHWESQPEYVGECE
jgi:hypothetical protein